MSDTTTWIICGVIILVGAIVISVLTYVFRMNTAARAWLLRVVCRVRKANVVHARPEHQLSTVVHISNNGEDVTDGRGATRAIDDWGYSTELAEPPPNYDEALAMKRPERGQVVRFFVGQGEDGVVFEFSMPKNIADSRELQRINGLDDQCLPPRYCGRHVSQQTMSVGDLRSEDADIVEDPSAETSATNQPPGGS